MKTQSTIGVFIDCQNDFVNDGPLGVPCGAEALTRIGDALQSKSSVLDDMICTQDWHPKNHFVSVEARRIVDQKGKPLYPFSRVTMQTFGAGSVRAATEDDQAWLGLTVQKLHQSGEKELTVWPEHCVAGTPGADLYESFEHGVNAWEQSTGKISVRHLKGRCAEREQYGAFADEIPGKYSGKQQYDDELIERIRSYDRKIWGGLARSHCLSASFNQVLARELPDQYKTHIVLTDGTADVPGFESEGQQWQSFWARWGVQFMTVADAFST